MTLDGVTALILLYFTEFDSFAGLSRHSGYRVVEDRPILSAEYGLSLFCRNWPTVQRGLSAIAKLHVLMAGRPTVLGKLFGHNCGQYAGA